MSVCLSVCLPDCLPLCLSVCLSVRLSVCLSVSVSVFMTKTLSVLFPRSYRGIFTALGTLPTVIDLSDHLTVPFIVTHTRWVNNLAAEAALHQRVLVCIDLVTHQTSHTSRQVGLKATSKIWLAGVGDNRLL